MTVPVPLPAAAGTTTAAVRRLSARAGGTPTLGQRAVDRLSGWLAPRTSRRGFLLRAGVVGTALAVDPVGFVLRPGTAYASVCGPSPTASGGWTVFCATINNGVNSCPPGSIAAGWWKADGANLCGGTARYIVDCNATCASCNSPGARPGICASRCWSCDCTTGPASSCDRRKNCCNAFRYGQCNTQVRQVGGVQCRVVSCTPPWKWERCTTSPATDNRTRDHSSDALPTAWTALTARYKAIGENGSVLGATVYREFAVAGGAGRAQRYERGRISWSRATGARETVGAVSTRYVVVGGEAGALGFPTSVPLPAKDRRGTGSRFQRGRISWHPETGAWDVRGALATRYERDGAENGPLGYPVAGEQVLGDRRGRASRFTGGRISWHPSLGAFLARTATAERYVAEGAEDGPLGYPVADERPAAGGSVTTYQRGVITWHPAAGAFAVRGPLLEAHDARGGVAGVLGFAAGAEQTVPGGAAQAFTGGRLSAGESTGVHATLGPIAARYVQAGAEGGLLGFPTTEQYAPDVHLRRSDFQRGRITLDLGTGQAVVEPWVATG